MRMLIYALVLTLAGCATATPVALPDGSKGYSIDCGGTGFTISDCMNKAAEVCAGPYTVLGSNSESTAGMLMPVGNSLMYMQGINRTMVVACGAH